jgi:hypothetical protein
MPLRTTTAVMASGLRPIPSSASTKSFWRPLCTIGHWLRANRAKAADPNMIRNNSHTKAQSHRHNVPEAARPKVHCGNWTGHQLFSQGRSWCLYQEQSHRSGCQCMAWSCTMFGKHRRRCEPAFPPRQWIWFKKDLQQRSGLAASLPTG